MSTNMADNKVIVFPTSERLMPGDSAHPVNRDNMKDWINIMNEYNTKNNIGTKALLGERYSLNTHQYFTPGDFEYYVYIDALASMKEPTNEHCRSLCGTIIVSKELVSNGVRTVQPNITIREARMALSHYSAQNLF